MESPEQETEGYLRDVLEPLLALLLGVSGTLLIDSERRAFVRPIDDDEEEDLEEDGVGSILRLVSVEDLV